MADLESLSEQVAALEASLGGAASMAAAFDGELRQMQSSLVFTGCEVNGLASGIGGGLRRAFDGLIFDGMRLSDALRMIGRSMIDSIYNAAMRPVQQALGGAIASGLNAMMSSIMPFEKGGVFSQGKVMPFAEGGVVSSPVMFPMRGATGLMGEAGPEAILPLERGPDGRLGVQAGGGGRSVHVVFNISTPDVAGFQRSQTQIAAQMNRLLAQGQRNG